MTLPRSYGWSGPTGWRRPANNGASITRFRRLSRSAFRRVLPLRTGIDHSRHAPSPDRSCAGCGVSGGHHAIRSPLPQARRPVFAVLLSGRPEPAMVGDHAFHCGGGNQHADHHQRSGTRVDRRLRISPACARLPAGPHCDLHPVSAALFSRRDADGLSTHWPTLRRLGCTNAPRCSFWECAPRRKACGCLPWRL